MYKNRPVICITSDTNSEETGATARELRSPRAYSSAIYIAGGLPFIAPEVAASELGEICDGLLLTGGADVEPELYGEEQLNDTVHTDPERTAYEKQLAEIFLAQNKPILTICRGVQVLNCIMGGDVYQDLVEQYGVVHMNRLIRHNVTAEKGSILCNIFGERFRTNSTHHEAIRKLAPGFKVTARSDEGIIEAVEHETRPIFGTQFHPERLTGSGWDDRTPDFAPYFKYYVDLVRKDAEKR